MKLRGRGAIITGAGRGLGEEIAKYFVREGASVLLCDCSNTVDSVREKLNTNPVEGQKVLSMPCDVSKTADLDALFACAAVELPSFDILVNNAGVHGPLGQLDQVDWDDWVAAVQINLLGTVYACRLAVPLFKSRGYGKIINLSGGGATSPLPGISAYAASKAAVVRFTETLAHELKDWRIDVNAIAPGALKTRITEDFLAAGPAKIGPELYEKLSTVNAEGGTPLSLGARCCVYLGSSDSDGITGRLIAAQWDPWLDLQSRAEDIRNSDIYTLRRIVPKDRAKSWGGSSEQLSG